MEFIKGFDCSTLLEVERCGGRFYDGGGPEDAMTILRRYGGNWMRFRLWNDPYDELGGDYGAGVCDLPRVLELAHRAKRLGMDWLLDFHYSDFWADPCKQFVPKAWRNLDEDGLEAAVYRYTKDVLCACRAAGVTPGMVQVGNELTHGLLWPTGRTPNYQTICRYVMAGVRAVREEAPQAKVMVHLDNASNKALYRDWFDRYFANGGQCDIIGLSYYPLWHGTLPELAENLRDVAANYGKDLVLAETSYVFSLESYARYEGLPDSCRKGSAFRPEMMASQTFPMTPQGQAEYVRALLAVLDDVPGGRGKGLFWWEPAWLPLPGSGWAKKSGWEYVHEKGPGGNEWANQGLFDYEGHVLPALAVIRDHA